MSTSPILESKKLILLIFSLNDKPLKNHYSKLFLKQTNKQTNKKELKTQKPEKQLQQQHGTNLLRIIPGVVDIYLIFRLYKNIVR